ncbi:MAG: hypothetical protein JW969_14645 [Spirochaetales bacterium]|nr:hypothetical protein [Spirochaetales bacterium]
MLLNEELERFSKIIGIVKKLRYVLVGLFFLSLPLYLYHSEAFYFGKAAQMTAAEQKNALFYFFLFQTVSSVLMIIALASLFAPALLTRILENKYVAWAGATYFPDPESLVDVSDLVKLLSIHKDDLHRIGLDGTKKKFNFTEFKKGFRNLKKADKKWDRTRKFRIGVKF